MATKTHEKSKSKLELEEGAQALAKAVETDPGQKPKEVSLADQLVKAAEELDAGKDLAKADMIVGGKHVDKPAEGAKVGQPKDQADQRGGPEGNQEDQGHGGGDDPDKDDEPDEEMPSDEREKSEARARDEFFKSVVDEGGDEITQLLEASEALQVLTASIGRAEGRRAAEVGRLQKSVETLAARVDKIGEVVGLLAKSQAVLHKSEMGRPARMPMPGMIYDPRGERGTRNGQAISKGEVVDALMKAIHEGKLDQESGSSIMTKLDSNFQAAIAAIPDEVAKAYSIPKDQLLRKAD